MNRSMRRRGAAAQQYAIVVGLIAVVAIVAVSALGGTTRQLMGNVGNTISTATNQATAGGGGGGQAQAPADLEPDVFDFADMTGAFSSSQAESAILPITGHTGVPVSITGGGTPQFRICNDSACSSVAAGYATTGTIADNQYLQLRLTSASANFTALSATVTVGSRSDFWTVTTGTTYNTGVLKTITVGGQNYTVALATSASQSCTQRCSAVGLSCNVTKLQALQAATTQSTGAYYDLVSSKLGLTLASSNQGNVSSSSQAFILNRSSDPYFGIGCNHGTWAYSAYGSNISGCMYAELHTGSNLTTCSENSSQQNVGQFYGPRICTCE